MSDALERLKNKNRPVVENRDTSLTSTTPDTSMSGYLETKISDNLGKENKEGLETEMSGSVEVKSVKEVAKPEEELQTKQSTLRLETGVSDRLQVFCREQGICREVLIEAMFEYCEDNEKALSKILNQAKGKNEYRQQIANRRRAKSMMEKFG